MTQTAAAVAAGLYPDVPVASAVMGRITTAAFEPDPDDAKDRS